MYLGSGYATPFGPFDFELDASMELDDVDLEFLDSYNTNIPFHTTQFNFTPSDSRNMGDSVRGSTPRGICTDAFAASEWLFRPGANDHGAAEEHNLSIPTTSAHNSPESIIPVDTRITSARLETAGRDKILTTAMKSCRTDSMLKAVASFPSVDLLDSLIQFCLSSSSSQTKYYIHTSTFDPNQRRPELVAAVVAQGAVLTLDPALTKLGYALQECMRVAVPKLVSTLSYTILRNSVLAHFFFLRGILFAPEADSWLSSGRSKIHSSETWNLARPSSSCLKSECGVDVVGKLKSRRASCNQS